MGATARLAIRSALVASMLGAAAWPAVAAAADQDGVVILGGFTSTAGVIDLDGDGTRELVRLVGESEGSDLVVEVWSWEGSAWAVVARLPLDRPRTGSQPFARGDEPPVTPLLWHDGERERLLLATGEPDSQTGGVSALSISSISLGSAGLALTSVLTDGGPAERIDAADLDGDGVEELLVTEPGGHLGRDRAVWLLRWSNGRFVGDRVVVGPGTELFEPILGETDGTPGVDVLFTGDGSELYRLSPGRSSRLERADLPLPERSAVTWPMGVADGAIFLMVEEPPGTSLVRVDWPAGRKPMVETVAAGDPRSSFFQPIATDDGVRFVEHTIDASGRLLHAMIRDEEMRPLARVEPGAAIQLTQPWADLVVDPGPYGAQAFPYSGTLPGGVDGAPAMILAGNLAVFGDGEIEIRPVGSFAGMAPLGLIGPDDGWIALTSPWWTTWEVAYLYAQPRMEDNVRIARAEVALDAEPDGGALDVELIGATRVSEPDGTWVASPDGGFEIVVRGPPGSSVTAMVGRQAVGSGEIGPDGRAVLRLDPRPRLDETVDYSAAVVMVTPTGHLHATEWPGRVLREPPELEATGVTETGAFAAAVSGEIDGTATVTVDGEPVSVGEDGAFEVTVEAGLLPRDVVVVATDPLGTETARRVQVVGFVDHRGWPWPAFMGVLIAAAGAVMFVRVPRGRTPETAIPTEATIEEIEVP